jgi:hypothetical protein
MRPTRFLTALLLRSGLKSSQVLLRALHGWMEFRVERQRLHQSIIAALLCWQQKTLRKALNSMREHATFRQYACRVRIVFDFFTYVLRQITYYLMLTLLIHFETQ